MAFGLIIIGDEILSGKRSDQHLPKVIELLGERGLQLAWAEIVGDDPARITALLERSGPWRSARTAPAREAAGAGADPRDRARDGQGTGRRTRP
jgi:hypothetical protein